MKSAALIASHPPLLTFNPLGVLNYLKETFTHTPSYDMSPAMLSVLVKMMLAQAQECLFEQLCLPGIQNEFFTLMKMAQEAAKVNHKGTFMCMSLLLVDGSINWPLACMIYNVGSCLLFRSSKVLHTDWQ